MRPLMSSIVPGVLSGIALVATSSVNAAAKLELSKNMIFATKIMDNMQRRTQAQEVQAYQASRAPAPSSGSSYQSAESRLRELDKLAAGGYITPEEHNAKKQAIIDRM